MNTGDGTWANIVNSVNDDVDAIVSGHTHLEYNCSFTVPGWSDGEIQRMEMASCVGFCRYGVTRNGSAAKSADGIKIRRRLRHFSRMEWVRSEDLKKTTQHAVATYWVDVLR